jgi:hypothetical protein
MSILTELICIAGSPWFSGMNRGGFAMGLVRQINIPDLRIQRMFSWALPSGELGGLPGEFYQFANPIRSELSAVSVSPLKEPA